MRNLFRSKAVLLTLLGGLVLPQVVTCDFGPAGGYVYETVEYGYADPYYDYGYVDDGYYYEEPCCDDGWGFDFFWDGWW
jgi:hypothetical protein